MDNHLIFQRLYLNIGPERYHYLKFILEGYDNLAVLSCDEGKKGAVVIRYPKESEKEIFTLLASIAPLLITINSVYSLKN
jgi:hypothetical protein